MIQAMVLNTAADCNSVQSPRNTIFRQETWLRMSLLLAWCFIALELPMKAENQDSHAVFDAVAEKATVTTPEDLVNDPKRFLNKTIRWKARFASFSTLALDCKEAFRSSKTHVSFLVRRDNSATPLSELKLAMPIGASSELNSLREGDPIEIVGFEHSNALDEPWIDVLAIRKGGISPGTFSKQIEDLVNQAGQQSDHFAAIKLYEKALALDPNDRWVHATKMYLAKECQGAGMDLELRGKPDCIKYYRRAIEVQPNDQSYRDLLRGACVKFGVNVSEIMAKLPVFAEESRTIAAVSSTPEPKMLAVSNIRPLPVGTSSNIASTTDKQSSVPLMTNNSLESGSNNAIVNRPVKDKWALVIGISKFANPKYNLDFASKDARDFYDFLVNEANFRKDHVLLLLDEKATRANIMSAFGDNFLPAVSQENDLVVVYISTHGTPAKRDKGGQSYIVAHDTDTASLYATGVNMDELYKRIRTGVKTDRALIVMDTCFSGAGVPGAKALNVADNFDAQEVAQGCGHLVITSSSPNERSWESKISNNSVFTKYLLEALRQNNKKVDVRSAFRDVQKKVSWEVQSAFGERQTPQLGGEWEGKELILAIPPIEPRALLNPDLLKQMNSPEQIVSGTKAAKGEQSKQAPATNHRK